MADEPKTTHDPLPIPEGEEVSTISPERAERFGWERDFDIVQNNVKGADGKVKRPKQFKGAPDK